MKNRWVLIGAGVLMIGNLSLRPQVNNRDQQLQQLGYTNEEISLLLELDPKFVQELVELNDRSEDIFDYMPLFLFNETLYHEYVQFAYEYSHLNLEEVVATVTFLNHIFIPTLHQLGYKQDIIVNWLQSESFKKWLAEADLVSLNQLLRYAKESRSELEFLQQYIDYEKRAPHLTMEEVMVEVCFYNSVVIPTLEERNYSIVEIEKISQQLGMKEFQFLLKTDLEPRQTMALLETSGFNPAYLSTYEEILSREVEPRASYAVQLVKHPYVIGTYAEDPIQVFHQESFLALVNQNMRLSHDYRPTDLIVVNVPVSEAVEISSNLLRLEAAKATEALFVEALKAGHELRLCEGYISFEAWQHLYDQTMNAKLSEDSKNEISMPGHSEYQTGLAIAITTAELENDFSLTEASQWVIKNAHRFGFILRYPEERELETGVAFKPNHLRYVGVEVATEIYENHWLLEDYILTYEVLDLAVES